LRSSYSVLIYPITSYFIWCVFGKYHRVMVLCPNYWHSASDICLQMTLVHNIIYKLHKVLCCFTVTSQLFICILLVRKRTLSQVSTTYVSFKCLNYYRYVDSLALFWALYFNIFLAHDYCGFSCCLRVWKLQAIIMHKALCIVHLCCSPNASACSAGSCSY